VKTRLLDIVTGVSGVLVECGALLLLLPALVELGTRAPNAMAAAAVLGVWIMGHVEATADGFQAWLRNRCFGEALPWLP